jgi:hypothetical protein
VEDEEFDMTNLNLGPNVEAPPRNGIRILMDKLLQLLAIVSSVSDVAGGVAISGAWVTRGEKWRMRTDMSTGLFCISS